MGSRITRTFEHQSRNRPVQPSKIPMAIKLYVCTLSFISAFSLGYIQHQNNTNVKNTMQAWLILASSLIISLFKIQKMMLNVSILMFVLLWIPHTEWLVNVTLKALMMTLLVIIFGEYKQNSGIWIMVNIFCRLGGGVLNEIIQIHSIYKPPLIIKAIFGVISVMSILLIVNGIQYTKSKHPMPTNLNRYFQYVFTFKKTIWYGFLFLLLSLGNGRHEMNGFKIQLYPCFGFVMAIIIMGFIPRPLAYKYYLFLLVLITSFSQYMGQKFGLISFGLIECLKVMLVIQAMSVERRLGSAFYFIGTILGTVLPMYFHSKNDTFRLLQVIGVALCLLIIIIRQKLQKKQYNRVIPQFQQ